MMKPLSSSQSRAARGLAFSIALASATAFAPPARAQSSERAAAAQALFDLAIQLMTAGRAAEACPKLEESQRLDPGMGTQFRLAECYEKVGKTASAWAEYTEVADTARLARQPERAVIAKQRADALAPRLSRLTVVVSPPTAAAAGLEVARDGVALGRPLWGTPVPVDPGEHVIIARAPGKKDWRGRSFVGPAAAQVEVAIPPLEDLPRVDTPPPPPPRRGRSAAPAIVLGILGGAGLGVGGALFAVHAGQRGDAEALSGQIKAAHHSCVPKAANLDARCGTLASKTSGSDTTGNLSTAAFAIGGAGVAAMVIYLLWPAAPQPSGSALQLHPVVGPGHQGLMATGSF